MPEEEYSSKGCRCCLPSEMFSLLVGSIRWTFLSFFFFIFFDTLPLWEQNSLGFSEYLRAYAVGFTKVGVWFSPESAHEGTVSNATLFERTRKDFGKDACGRQQVANTQFQKHLDTLITLGAFLFFPSGAVLYA